jgi:hypothetical protein
VTCIQTEEVFNYGQHPYPNLHSCRLCRARPAKSDSKEHKEELHKIHHRYRTEQGAEIDRHQEYLEMLQKFEVEYDEKYLFKWIEDA